MIELQVIPHEPLVVANFTWSDRPDNLGTKSIELQELYLSNRDSEPLYFQETILELVNLIKSNQLLPLDQTSNILGLAFSTVNLIEIYLIFSQPEITEMYCNKIGNRIVISHLKYGRCLTNLEFTPVFWEALRIRVEYDSGIALEPNKPALKIGLQSPLGNLRISIQDKPLSPNGPVFSIRRLPHTPITMTELVSQNQITKSKADYLVKLLQNRANIVIAGEPGSGKTTLANALLLETLPFWRLIVMEDAREVQINPEKFPMVVHYALPTVGEDDRYHKRSEEIARLLHRSPDYVFLGELQTKDDTEVAFEGFAAGIRGMATTHATNISGLLMRWTYSHKLPKDLIQSINCIAMTEREFVENNVKLTISDIYIQNVKQDQNVWEVVEFD